MLGFDAGNLITLKERRSAGSKCCSGSFILSCSKANVNLDMVGADEITMPDGATLQFQKNILENLNSYLYSGNGGEAVFSISPDNPSSIYGHFATTQGDSYFLEYCGKDAYIWKHLDTISMSESPSLIHNDMIAPADVKPVIERDYDNTTIVEFSVKIYYTAELEADTADLDNFIAQVIDETNQGYINSEIPLRIKAHCPEKLAIAESGDSYGLLSQLKALNNNNYSMTRDGADTAALLVLKLDNCGMAYLYALDSGMTFSVTAKACATGYYSFAHEIGHNIGALHNPEVSINSLYPYGLGHLIEAGDYSTGLRTIMAYNYAGYETRVNYWSNPAVKHPLTNTPTGIAEKSNNAALLTLLRFQLSGIGDETTGSCKVIKPSSTVQPPTTSTPAPGEIQCDRITKSLKRFQSIKGVTDELACQRECQNMFDKGCELFNFKKKNCDLFKYATKKVKGACTGKPYMV